MTHVNVGSENRKKGFFSRRRVWQRAGKIGRGICSCNDFDPQRLKAWIGLFRNLGVFYVIREEVFDADVVFKKKKTLDD